MDLGGAGLSTPERDVLVALCRPVLHGSLLSEPATTAAIVSMLAVSSSTVDELLAVVYDKLGMGDGERTRQRLASEALRRGLVSLADR